MKKPKSKSIPALKSQAHSTRANADQPIRAVDLACFSIYIIWIIVGCGRILGGSNWKRDFSGFAGDWQTIAYDMAAGMCSPKSRASQPLHSTPKDGAFR